MTKSQTITEKTLHRMERIAGIGHWRWDVYNNALFWSKGIYEIHGIKDFKNFTPSIEVAIDAYLEEDRVDIEENLTRAIEKKEPFEIQKRIKRPNGEIRHVISQGECELDEDGEVCALFGILQDITPLKSQEELYELAALGSSAALLDWDIDDDKIRWAGRSAEILGYDDNVFLPKDSDEFYYELIHREDVMALQVAFIEHFKTREPFSVNLRIQKQNGGYEWFTVRAQAQFDSNNRATRLCGSLTNINDLKKAVHDLQKTKNQLEHSNKDLENFATVAAHDLKDPLRSISGYLDILKDEYADKLDVKAQEYIKNASKSADGLSIMVVDLLDYASLQKRTARFKKIDLNKTIKLAIRGMKMLVKDSNAQIDFEKMPTLICDEPKINRLFSNLIQNALKYRSQNTPSITIKAEELENAWQFSIQDNGIGIPEHAIDHIFEMFQRVDSYSETKGTGIGLASCKRIIELHDGKIWVESKLDEGSIFHFTLSKSLEENDVQ